MITTAMHWTHNGWCSCRENWLVTCTRCGNLHHENRECVEDSFDPRDHDDREMP